jgi:acyl carrier protein
MNKEQALDAINTALRKTLDDADATVEPGVDMVESEILDSLDGMVFIMELSGFTDKKFPETDLVDLGFYKVDKLIDFLTTP